MQNKWIFLLPFLLISTDSLAQVFNGQAVNATITNNAYWKRNVDDTGFGIYTLGNTNASSGTTINNLQAEENACASYTGMPVNSAYNVRPSWSNNDVGSSTDTLRTRADLITAKFNSTAGHKHTGASGDAPQLTDASLSSSAAISRSKIAAGPTGQIVYNDPSTGLLSSEASVPVTQGGTGQASLTLNNVILGNGTSGVQFVAPGANGNVLTSNGTTWLSQAPSASGTIAPTYFEMSGGVTFGNMGPPDEADVARTVSKIACTMRNSGSSGSTVVTIAYGATLGSSTTISITANGGLNYSEVATPGISQSAHDYIDMYVSSVAKGAPNDLRCKILY